MRSFQYQTGPSGVGSAVAVWPVCVLVAAEASSPLVPALLDALAAVPSLEAVLPLLEAEPSVDVAAAQVQGDGVRVIVRGGAVACAGSASAVVGGIALAERVFPAGEPLRIALRESALAGHGPHLPLRWGVGPAAAVRLAPPTGPDDVGPAMTFAPIVPAVVCPRDHANPPEAIRCRVCGRPLRGVPVVSLPRPSLGVLRLSSGARIPLDRGAVFGRDPHAVPDDGGTAPNLVRITDPEKDISAQHLAVRLKGWQVLVTDLDSTNGTAVFPPHGPALELIPGEPVAIVPGTRVVLANVIDFVYEL